MTAADICRERGWGVGDSLLLETEWRGVTFSIVYRITATGEDSFLVRDLGRRRSDQSDWLVTGDVEEAVPADDLAKAKKLDHLPWEEPTNAT